MLSAEQRTSRMCSPKSGNKLELGAETSVIGYTMLRGATATDLALAGKLRVSR